MKLWKTISAVIGAVSFLSAALSASFFMENTQHSHAAKNYALTQTSSTKELAGYFKNEFQTLSSLDAITNALEDNGAKCEDVLLDKDDIDACLFAISLSKSNNLKENLSYDSADVKEISLDGAYVRDDWNEMSNWSQRLVDELVNLEEVYVKNYKGQSFINISNPSLKILSFDKVTGSFDKSFMSRVSGSLEELTFTNSGVTSLSSMQIHRFEGLKELHLSNNKITTLSYLQGGTTFNLGSLTNLEVLDLSNNSVENISGLFSRNVSPNQFTEVNLKSNDIDETEQPTEKLVLANTMVNVNLSGNKLENVDFFFNNIEFSNSIASEFKTLGEVDLSSNKITVLPSSAAAISNTLILKDNEIEEFSTLVGDAKLKQVILNEDDIDKDIWTNKSIFKNSNISTVSEDYLGWLIATGEVDENKNQKLSELQIGYIKNVLLEVGVRLFNLNLINSGAKDKAPTLEQLTSDNLKEGAINLDSILATVSPPTNKEEFANSVLIWRETINNQIIQANSNYQEYLRLLEKFDDETNTILPEDTTIVVIVLSVFGLIVASAFTGVYFFRTNKKKKNKGEF